MSFFDHITELRKHILRSVLAIMVIAVACFLNKDFIFSTIIFGPRNPDFPTYRIICNASHSMGLGESGCMLISIAIAQHGILTDRGLAREKGPHTRSLLANSS